MSSEKLTKQDENLPLPESVDEPEQDITENPETSNLSDVEETMTSEPTLDVAGQVLSALKPMLTTLLPFRKKLNHFLYHAYYIP